jgi:transcriptional regulator with XRE-family HTH domain
MEKGLTQRAVAERSGLLNTHISRIESGARLPSVQTVRRLAAALEVPLYSLFYNNGSPTTGPDPALLSAFQNVIAKSQEEADEPFLRNLIKAFVDLNEADCELLLAAARKMARRKYAEK